MKLMTQVREKKNKRRKRKRRRKNQEMNERRGVHTPNTNCVEKMDPRVYKVFVDNGNFQPSSEPMR